MSGDNDLITRQELADTLEIGKSTVCRWEKKGILTPIINERNTHLFRVADVRHLIEDRPIVRLKQAKPHVPSAENASGAVAAAIFGRLENGESVAKIVTELRVHPDVVMGIGATWLRVQKGLFLRSRHVTALANALGATSKRDPEEFMEELLFAIRNWRRPCNDCGENRACYCRQCHRKRVNEAKAEVVQRYRASGATTEEAAPTKESSVEAPSDDGTRHEPSCVGKQVGATRPSSG